MNTENSKTNELHQLFLSLSQRLDLRSCSSNFIFLLHVEKYKTTVQKQLTQNNSSNVK